jgi:hypothetical protein
MSGDDGAAMRRVRVARLASVAAGLLVLAGAPAARASTGADCVDFSYAPGGHPNRTVKITRSADGVDGTLTYGYRGRMCGWKHKGWRHSLGVYAFARWSGKPRYPQELSFIEAAQTKSIEVTFGIGWPPSLGFAIKDNVASRNVSYSEAQMKERGRAVADIEYWGQNRMQIFGSSNRVLYSIAPTIRLGTTLPQQIISTAKCWVYDLDTATVAVASGNC